MDSWNKVILRLNINLHMQLQILNLLLVRIDIILHHIRLLTDLNGHFDVH